MKTKNKKMDIIQYSKSMDKNLRLINKNKNLKEILQDFNNINSKILRYQQIENLLNYIKTKDSEKKPEDINSDKEKEILLEEMKLLQNRLYKSNIENNSKKNVKEVMKDMFGKRDVHNTRRYFPKAKIKLKHLKNLNDMNMNFSERQIEREERHKRLSNNICSTERNINQTKKKLERNYTLESEKNKNVNYMNYASNCVKFKHPQFYLLNLSNVNSKKHLPPIKINKVKMVNLFCKNNNYLKNEEQKRNKFEKYMVAMQMGGISKFKVNE
jgi:hypothetical protein